MKHFTIPRIIFLSIIIIPVTLVIATFLIHYWRFGSVSKMILHFESLQIFNILADNDAPTKIKFLAYKALGTAFIVSCLACAALSYYMLYKDSRYLPIK